MIKALKQHRTGIACAFVALAMIPAVAGLSAVAHVSDKVDIGAGVAPYAKRVALVIANVDYPDADAPLARTNLEDARSLAGSLRGRGFDVDLEENVSKATLHAAVDGFVAKVRPGVTALVSFSGYGIQSDRENFLIPTDAQIWNDRDVKRDGTSLSALLARLNAKGAERTIAIVDASWRNPFERRFRPVSGGLAAMEPPRDTLVLSTSIPGRTVEQADASARPIRALSDAMKTDHSDAEMLFDHAKSRISLASGGREVPTVSSALVGGFVF